MIIRHILKKSALPYQYEDENEEPTAKEITNVRVRFVSLVDRAANNKRFALLKSNNGKELLDSLSSNLDRTSQDKNVEYINDIRKKLDNIDIPVRNLCPDELSSIDGSLKTLYQKFMVKEII